MSRSESEPLSSAQRSRRTRPDSASPPSQAALSPGRAPAQRSPSLYSENPAQNPAQNPADPDHSPASHGHLGHGFQPGHVHDAESIRRIVNRLSRIEGHVRGIKRMVQEQENCPDVLVQLAAVRGAVDKVSRLILDEHLSQCIARAAQQGNIETELAQLQAALNRFLPS